MKAEDKPTYVQESRKLFSSLNLDELLEDCNNLEEIAKINRLSAIFKNFSFNDGQELERLFSEFQKWARRSTSKGTIKNRAVDMLRFIGQKIEDMDIYVIENPKNVEERIVKELKNENLWVRTTVQGKDTHVMIGERDSKEGEHIHLVFDSRTGEVRIDPKDKSPNQLIKKVISITTREGGEIGISQDGVKTTMEFTNSVSEKDKIEDIPILFPANNIRRSGGSTGQFVYFPIKNISNFPALEIQWCIRGFDYEWKSNEAFELLANQEKEIEFVLTSERILNEPVKELNIILEYQDTKGTRYFVRRELTQQKVPSGAFYELKASTYHHPSVMVDDGLKLITEPYHLGDKDEGIFEIKSKRVKIGMSGSLSAVLGFTNKCQISQAILELGHRKIRQMVKKGELDDYCFMTTDLPEQNINGFEAYVKLRDSILY